MTEPLNITRLRVDVPLGVSLSEQISAASELAKRFGIELVIEADGAELIVGPTPEQRWQTALGKKAMEEIRSLDFADTDEVLAYMLKIYNCQGFGTSPTKILWHFLVRGGYHILPKGTMAEDPELKKEREAYLDWLIAKFLYFTLDRGFPTEDLATKIIEFRNC